MDKMNLHCLMKALLVHRKLDGNVGQVSINFLVDRGPHC